MYAMSRSSRPSSALDEDQQREDGEQQVIRQRRAVPRHVVGVVAPQHIRGQPATAVRGPEESNFFFIVGLFYHTGGKIKKSNLRRLTAGSSGNMLNFHEKPLFGCVPPKTVL